MRKNLSEELKINDDVVLDDGEFKGLEEIEEGEKLDKEIQDAIDEKNDIADEIREPKEVDIKAKDGFGKTVKIKNFVESKLVLDEPTNELNEDFTQEDFNDRESDYFFIAVTDVLGVLKKYKENIANLEEETGINYSLDLDEACESICETAIMKL